MLFRSVQGYIVVARTKASIVSVARTMMRNVNLISLALFFLFGCMFIWFAYYHTVALRRLSLAAVAYTDGNFEYEMNIENDDEYRDIANAVQYLAEQHANLVDYQKNFIANISHDFRSPLTSVKGYAEAMKDGTIPFEIQGKYLNIILFETERLSNLTNDLLDLSNFENKGVHLSYIKFDIAKMLKQSSMTFEGKCSQKNLKIRLIFAEPSILVYADKGKIQQIGRAHV